MKYLGLIAVFALAVCLESAAGRLRLLTDYKLTLISNRMTSYLLRVGLLLRCKNINVSQIRV